MEQPLVSSKPRPQVLRALRALTPPLQEKWGDQLGFREAASPIILREGGGAFATMAEADSLADLVMRTVQRLRAAHFRPVESQQALDAVFKALDPGVNSTTANPVVNGSLWLAYRIQGAVVTYLNSSEGKATLIKAETFLCTPPFNWLKALSTDTQPASLDRIEMAMAERLLEHLGSGASRFNVYAIVGHLLEQGRMAARQPPQLSLPDAAPRQQTPAERLMDALTEPVRNAELAEARMRFSKLAPEDSTRRFEEFKLQFLRMVGQVAQFATLGFEPFCQAIESVLYAYPTQMEWIRPFIKPVWTNASQSTLFEGRNTVELVNQRYQQMRKAKQGNPVLVELARAFAIERCQFAQQEQANAFLKDLDLVAEFQWPNSAEEMRAYWAKASHA
jgi:hypothetical protein